MLPRENFKRLRESKGISQLQLSSLSGFSNEMICRFERGKNDITMNVLLKLLECIGSSPAELFADDIHTLPLLELDDLSKPVGEVLRQGDYENCYAVINNKQGIFPQNSISVINPNSIAVNGDVIAYVDANGCMCFEYYRGLSHQLYAGVVIETDWNYQRD